MFNKGSPINITGPYQYDAGGGVVKTDFYKQEHFKGVSEGGSRGRITYVLR